MKKKVLAVLCAGLLGTAMTVSGTAGVFAAEEKEVETTADEAKNIGENVEGAFCVMLTNLTGKDVKAVKISENTKYDEEENLLQEEDVFAADEERMLCYLPEVKEEKEAKEDEKKEQEAPAYNIQFTFADDTTAEIHTFPFGDVEAGELHLEGEVAYLVFESVSQKKEINTLESETKIADEIKAAAEAAEAAEAAAAASSSSSGDDYYEDYSDYDYSDAGSGSDGGASGGGDACLGGGILY